jgi:hypothetical protein
MSEPAHRLTDAELDALTRRLSARPLPPDRSRTSVVDISTRKPLGLGIVDEPERDVARSGPGFKSTLWDGKDDAVLDAALSVRASYTMFDALMGATLEVSNQRVDEINDLQDRLKAKFDSLELENAKLRASVGELTARVESLTFISERLRVENAGPVGQKGERGRDGREGARGEVGLRGERGEPGKAAPTIVAWTLDEANFTATPTMSNGTTGAVLHARPLFEAFAEALSDQEVAEENDANARAREAVEREAALARQGLPTR